MGMRKGHYRKNPTTGKQEWVDAHPVSGPSSAPAPTGTPDSHVSAEAAAAADTDPLGGTSAEEFQAIQAEVAANLLETVGDAAPGGMSAAADAQMLEQHGTVDFEAAFATGGAPTSPDAAADAATLALVDYGKAAAPNVSSVRKARWDARKDLAESLVALEGREGMTKQEQVAALRESARSALRAAMALEAAAQHAEQRDLANWQQQKQQAGGLGLPALSDDGGFVTDPSQLNDDANGWVASKQLEGTDFDEELAGLLDDDPPGSPS